MIPRRPRLVVKYRAILHQEGNPIPGRRLHIVEDAPVQERFPRQRHSSVRIRRPGPALRPSRPREHPTHGQRAAARKRAATLLKRGHRTGAIQSKRPAEIQIRGEGGCPANRQRAYRKRKGTPTVEAGNGLVRTGEGADGDRGGKGAGDTNIIRRGRHRSRTPVTGRRPLIVCGPSCPIVRTTAASHRRRDPLRPRSMRLS